AERAAGDGDRDEPRVLARKAVLVLLAAAEEPVLLDAVLARRADRMRQEDKTDRGAVPRRVAARLVEALGAREAEPVPRRDRPALDLEEPEPEPAPLAGQRGELEVEGPLARPVEGRRALVPARRVEREERRELVLQ